MSDRKQQVTCNVDFRLDPIITLIDTISASAISGHRIYLGTESGSLYKYKVRKHIHRENRVTYQVKQKQTALVLKNKSIVHMVVSEALNYLLVLCNGIVKIFHLKDLRFIKDIPNVKDITSFCCNNDGHPFYGICVSTKNRLILYDLQHLSASTSKILVVPESPRVMRWFRKYLCLGFSNEYSIVPFNGDNPKGLLPVTNIPIIEILETEELVLSHKNTAVFAYASRRRSREILRFKSIPTKFAFSFPFLVSVSSDCIEIVNIMDHSYYFSLKKPFEVINCKSDGRDIMIVGRHQVFILQPTSNIYCTKDPGMLREVYKNPSDKGLFVRYINYVLREPRNPFRQLLHEFADKFVNKFHNPEEADLKIVKKYLDIALRKLNNSILSYFKQFEKKIWSDLLFSTLQTIFYARIYWLLFAMMTITFKNQDILNFEKSSTYKDITPGHLGAQKRFWLTKESLDDPPPKKQLSEETPESNPEEDIPDHNHTHHYPDDEDVAYLSYTDEFISQKNYDSQIHLPSEPIPRKRKVSVHKLKDTVSPSLQQLFLVQDKVVINAEVELHYLDDPLSTSSKIIGKGRLMNDDDEAIIIKLVNVPRAFNISPNNCFAYHRDSRSISWQQKDHHYKITFDEQFIFEDISNKLKSLEGHMRGATAKSDELMDNIVLRAVSEGETGDEGPEFHLDESSEENSFHFSSSSDTTKKTSSSSSNPNSRSTPSNKSPLISSSLTTISESAKRGEIELLQDSSPSTTVTDPPQPQQPAQPKSQEFTMDASPSSSPSSKGSPFNDSDDITLTFEQYQPYHRAIKTLRKISHLKSPRDKLGSILQTFKDIIQCVGDFWERYDREAVVGADDLVPIFAYVIIKARVPKIFSEMNFIWEFATDAEMNGKYGYGFATFQIGIEIISKLDDSIWQSLESTTDKNKPKMMTNPISEAPLPEETISEKRDQLVSQRLRITPSDNEEIE